MPAITRIGTTQRWSDVVIHNGTLYVVEVPPPTPPIFTSRPVKC